VTAIPHGLQCADAIQYPEICARYFGKPSPIASNLAGQTIWCAGGAHRGTCDVYGTELAKLTLAGDGWRKSHDAIKNAIAEVARSYGIPYTCEVFGFFGTLVPAGPGRNALMTAHPNANRGMVPDFRFGDLNDRLGVLGNMVLGELKRINYCQSWYMLAGPQSIYLRRAMAVNKRAALLQSERERDARKLDEVYGTTPANQTGPCLNRFRMHGKLQGFVVGHWGEWSKDLIRLVAAMCEVAEPRIGSFYDKRSPQEATAALLWKARRAIAWAGLKANAQLIIDRSEWAGPSYAVANGRVAARKARRAQHVRAACEARATQVAEGGQHQSLVQRNRSR
jgi:hypothetical protein